METTLYIRNKQKHFKYLTLLVIFYSSILCISDVLVQRLTVIHGFLMSSASLLIPITYLIVDIVTEVYGYRNARKLIWYGILAEIIFSVIGAGSNFLPIPAFWREELHYQVVLAPLVKNMIAYISASFCGLFLNAYLLSRWKVLVDGRFFIMRSLGSSVIGESVYVAVGFSILFIGVMPLNKILELMSSSILIKIFVNAVWVWVGACVTTILKRIEKCDVYDENISFNPFRIIVEKNN